MHGSPWEKEIDRFCRWTGGCWAENWWDQIGEGIKKNRDYRKMTGIGGIWELMWKPIVGETS